MKWRLPLTLLASGLLVMLAGFSYDLAFAGIPYQDPTPAMASRFRFHSRIASVIEVGGLVVLSLGVVVIAALAAWSLLRHRADSP